MNDFKVWTMLWLFYSAIREMHVEGYNRNVWGAVFLMWFIMCYTFLPLDYVIPTAIVLYILSYLAYLAWKKRTGKY